MSEQQHIDQAATMLRQQQEKLTKYELRHVAQRDRIAILEMQHKQQQAEIDRLNYDLDGFKQNFFVSGFHIQIKMANEQLVKQQVEIEALKQLLEAYRDDNRK